MRNIKNYIQEQFLIGNDNIRIQDYNYSPMNKNDLSTIIDKRIRAHKGKKDEVLDLNDIDTSRILDFSMLFYNRPDIVKIDISHWETQKVKNISFMFAGCSNLESIGDISEWDVGKLKNMKNAFAFCKKLKDIGDLNNWDINSDLNYENAFKNTDLKLPKWSLDEDKH